MAAPGGRSLDRVARTDQKIERLSQVAAFAGCGPKELQAIASISDELTLRAGETIITQGERLRHAYVVEDGTAKVEIDGRARDEVGPGDVLGELSMFDPAPAAATVTATSECRLLVIGFAPFEQAVRSSPDLAVALLRTMAQRFHQRDER